MPELQWPPKKEDLERMYLVEGLSAAKIAQAYGLKYASLKTAESTVLHHLKKNGITRRDKSDHIRIVRPEMVDEWVRRYQSGESLKQVAGESVSPSTILHYLRERGVELRDKVDAQILSVTKYEKRPFGGDLLERAYLLGLRLGDLDVVMHGRAVRVRVSTTHPAMASLFEHLFSAYGHIARYPRESPLTAHEWTLECDLHRSFEFLTLKAGLQDVSSLTREEFLAFLAGFFDAEGSIYLHNKTNATAPEVAISNKQEVMLALIRQRLSDLGIESKLLRVKQDPGRLGRHTPGFIWRLAVWRIESVKLLLEALKLRHEEKVLKSKLALRLTFSLDRTAREEVLSAWDLLRVQINRNRVRFINEAREAAEVKSQVRILAAKSSGLSAESPVHLSDSTGQ